MAIPVVLIIFLACISTILTPPCTADSVMYPGNRLLVGQSMTSGDYAFTMEKDCNLVLYDNRRLIWQSGTRGKGSGCYATLLGYGEFVINDYTDQRVWSSNTKLTNENCILILQRDRNVVMYCGSVWSSNTYIPQGPKALGRKMGRGNGGDDFHQAFVLVNSEKELQPGSMITEVINEGFK
ncbi:mannose-specific lectin-like [Magnolia sinica]|uniref:mannose-specific lectin-like n=1 Tax=Magnolia sinica TaxID=86752 RepID=UPI0026589543|nr:mannose-specific lectin-like [Magnolia sinica]